MSRLRHIRWKDRAMATDNVFWYFVGNRVEHLVLDGQPSLVTPHTYFMAPEGMVFPVHSRHLFKRKNPPAEIAERFGVAPVVAAERAKVIEVQTAEIEKAKEDAPREGQSKDPLPFEKAIKEFTDETNGEQPKSESRRDRKDRERKERKPEGD